MTLKHNAKRRGKIFTISMDDFAAVWVPGASIDRIDNSRGYEPGNIRALDPRENAIKGDRPQDNPCPF